MSKNHASRSSGIVDETAPIKDELKRLQGLMQEGREDEAIALIEARPSILAEEANLTWALHWAAATGSTSALTMTSMLPSISKCGDA